MRRANEVARRYGQALYDVMKDEAALINSARAIAGRGPLWPALLNPAIAAAEKKAALWRLAGPLPYPELRRFYELLIDSGRLALLPEICREYHQAALAAQGVKEALLTCVRPPDGETAERLRETLCRLRHCRAVELSVRLDPALIGGFILEIDGITYDKSVRGRLEAMGRRLKERRSL